MIVDEIKITYLPRLVDHIKKNDSMIRSWRVSDQYSDIDSFFNRFRGQNTFPALLYYVKNHDQYSDDILQRFLTEGNITVENVNNPKLYRVSGTSSFLSDPRLVISLDYIMKTPNRDHAAFETKLDTVGLPHIVDIAKKIYDADLDDYLTKKMGVVVIPTPSRTSTLRIIQSKGYDNVVQYINQPDITNEDLTELLITYRDRIDVLNAIATHPNFNSEEAPWYKLTPQIRKILNNRSVSIDTILSWRMSPHILEDVQHLTSEGRMYKIEILSRMMIPNGKEQEEDTEHTIQNRLPSSSKSHYIKTRLNRMRRNSDGSEK